MRAAIVLSAMLAACRFGFDPLTTEDCPQGACLVDGGPAVDAPRGSPATDTDGDGIFDDTDNCIAIQNASQHDEDLDAYGDPCDNCPTVANTNQANVGEANAGQSADSVGDACDPRPAQSGEAVAYFEPFAGSTLDADWSVINGAWTVADDAVQQTSLLSDQRIHDPAAVTANDYIVEATFTFAALDAGNVNAGVLSRMTNDNGWLCAVFHDDTIAPAMSLLMLWSLQNGAANFERNRMAIGDIIPGNRYRILAGAHGDRLYCALDSLQSGPTAPFVSNQNNSGVPGLRTNRVTGAYASFVVYTLGGPI